MLRTITHEPLGLELKPINKSKKMFPVKNLKISLHPFLKRVKMRVANVTNIEASKLGKKGH